MNPILIVGTIIIVGFVFGEIAMRLKLPKVTGYILAGILLNPDIAHFIPRGAEKHTDFVINLSLCFITFSIGGSLLYSRIKRLGKGIIWITLLEAEFTFVAVIIGFLAFAHFFINPGGSWLTTIVPLSILIGCLASPTDPSPTLAIEHEYKAKGGVSSTIMGVSASDDALGIMNFCLAIVLAQAFVLHTRFSVYSSVLVPLAIIAGSIILGIVFGLLLNLITRFIERETEGVLIVVIAGILSLCFGVAALIQCDSLLATMVMGVFVVNFNPKHEKIFKILERYTEELIFVLFFTVSGMQLDFSVLSKSYMLILLFIIFRSLGKFTGTLLGATIAKTSKNIRLYTAGGLIPYGGIVVGLALAMKQNPAFHEIADIIISVIIGATVIHELIGSICVKIALRKAGEIK